MSALLASMVPVVLHGLKDNAFLVITLERDPEAERATFPLPDGDLPDRELIQAYARRARDTLTVARCTLLLATSNEEEIKKMAKDLRAMGASRDSSPTSYWLHSPLHRLR